MDVREGTSGNDTFNAPLSFGDPTDPTDVVQTLGAFDELNGGDGVDTLNATLNSGAAVAPFLTSIENVNLRSLNNGSGIDLANSTGVQTVTFANSGANTGVVTNAGAVANYAVNNQTGGVTVSGNTATALNLSFNKFGVAATASTFAAATGATSATVALTDSNVQINTVASVKTLSVAATGENKLKSASAGVTETITVTGAGSVNFDDNLSALKSLTAGDGGVTATITNATAGAVTVSTGAGKDSISVSAPSPP